MEVSLIILTSIFVGLSVGSLVTYLMLRLKNKPFSAKHYWDGTLEIALVIFVIGALAMLGYVMSIDTYEEPFTEFYILGEEGKAENYPAEIKLGDKGTVIVGIINHEGRDVSYRLEVLINSQFNGELGPIVIVKEHKWEDKVSFFPEVTGENQMVEFLLYKDYESKPFLNPLHLWLDVKE